MRLRALIAAAALLSSVAEAAAPIHLAPSTNWVVDYADNSCRLIRRFGEGKDMTIFALESEAPGALDMLIVGKPLATTQEKVEAKFLPLQTKSMVGQPGFSADRSNPLVLWSTNVRLEPDDLVAAEEREEANFKARPDVRPPARSLAERAQLKAARLAFAEATTAIEVDPRRDRPVILDTGSLDAAMKAFDQCGRDSLRDWGVDPEVEDKIVRGVWAPNPGKWFSSGDYPRDMLLRLQESVVKVRLLVDATGHVTKCTSLSHFREPEFNRIICDKFMKRAHFEPAELADGTKVPSYYVNKVFFKIVP